MAGRDRWDRMENNPEIQVGLIAYPNGDDVPPQRAGPEAINSGLDSRPFTAMAMDVDRIHYRLPPLVFRVDWYGLARPTRLPTPTLSGEQMLTLPGD